MFLLQFPEIRQGLKIRYKMDRYHRSFGSSSLQEPVVMKIKFHKLLIKKQKYRTMFKTCHYLETTLDKLLPIDAIFKWK